MNFKFLCRWMTVKEAGMGLPAKVGHRAFADWLGTAHQHSFRLRCPAFFCHGRVEPISVFRRTLKILICF
jgi:hypothetical protein